MIRGSLQAILQSDGSPIGERQQKGVKAIPDCYLHIGTEKTGSTSLQKSLLGASDQLNKQDISYIGLRTHNSRALVAAMADYTKEDNIHIRQKLTTIELREDFRDKITTDLYLHLRTSTFSKTIISSEHFHSMITLPDEVNRIRNLLVDHFDKIFIIIYLRPQVDLAVSRYSTRLLSGYSEGEVLPDYFNPDNHYFNYNKIYNLWADIFGSDFTMVRDFTSVKDITADFCSLIDAEKVPSLRVNERLDAVQIAFLRLLNTRVKKDNTRRADRRRQNAVDKIMSVTGNREIALINRRDAEKFQFQFNESNDLLEAKLGRSLFTINFNKYPDKLTSHGVTNEELFDVFYSILK